MYAHWLLRLPESHPAKEILPISLRKGDGNFQPDELPENYLLWTQNAQPKLYGQWQAWQIAINQAIDPAEGVEPVDTMKSNGVKANVIIKSKKRHLNQLEVTDQAWFYGRMDQRLVMAAPGQLFVGKKIRNGKKNVFSWVKTKRCSTQNYGQFQNP